MEVSENEVTIMYKGDVSDFIQELADIGFKYGSMTYGTGYVKVKVDKDTVLEVKKGEYLCIPRSMLKRDSKWKVDKDAPLAPVFIAYVEDPENEDKTFDDFFNDVGIPEDERSDFMTAAMLKQVQEIRDNLEEKGK